MKKLLFIFFTAGLIQGFSSCSHKDTPDNALALIPQPQEMKVGTDHFKLTRRAAITLDTSNPQLIGIARYFNNKVAPATGFEIPVEKHGNIEFKLTDNTAFGAEGYRLQVKHGDILLHRPSTGWNLLRDTDFIADASPRNKKQPETKRHQLDGSLYRHHRQTPVCLARTYA